MEITTVGLDLAKNVFQVHAIGSTGGVVVRRSLRRAQVIPFFSKLPPCLIGMEACGTSHHWARELVGLGHEVRLMPPAYVKPYVKRGKTDAGDAEAICEAVTRPTMRFVPIKSVEQQAALALHRTRDLLVRQRTQLVNMIRELLAEFGIDIPKGITNALAFVRRAVAGEANEVPDLAAKVIGALAEQAIEVQCRTALCNDASFDPKIGRASASGDTVDLAFLVLAAKASLDVVGLARRTPRVAEIPFDTGRKYAASLNRHEDEQRLHVKGAAEVIVPLCTNTEGAEVLKTAEEMAAGGYRVLAVATRPIAGAASEDWENLEGQIEELTLLGLVGFIDPLRPEAKQAVADCHRAGVAVKMITGDHPATALAIARELGIAESLDDVVTGHELSSLRNQDGAAQTRIARATVFARVEPTQKVQIVNGLAPPDTSSP